MYLDKLEYGEFHLELDKESIEKFLSNQEYYREKYNLDLNTTVTRPYSTP